jgi:hypothetical protein
MAGMGCDEKVSFSMAGMGRVKK